MPIYLRVGAELDDRSLRAAAEEGERFFARQDPEIQVKSKLDERSLRDAAKAGDRFFKQQEAAELKVQAKLWKSSLADAAKEGKQFFAREDAELKVQAKLDEKSVRDAQRELDLELKAQKKPVIEVETKVDHDALTRAGTESGQVFGQSFLNSLGTALPAGVGGQGGLAVAAALAPTLIDIGKGALTASQSIALLPAVLGAAGAAFGTFKLATQGFSDALGDMGDPKKFAADLQSLAPNAQQAALSIQNLMPAFKDLQQATQNSLFAGIGEEIHTLVNEYLPEVKTLTTSIADSFNNMLKGVGAQLMTPDTQLQLQNMMTNISTAFQNLAPAAQSVVQAIVDIGSAGSSFLPGLASSVADAARSFADFIRQARDSGELKQFIQDGIDAVKVFGDALWNIGGILYKTFGVDGQQNVQNLKNSMGDLTNAVGILADAFQLVSTNGQSMATEIKQQIGDCVGVAGAFRDAIMDIPEALAWVGNKAIDMANTVKHAVDGMITNLKNSANAMIPLADPFSFTPAPDIPHLPSGGDWRSGATPPGGATAPPGSGPAPGSQREHQGAPPVTTPNAGLPPYGGPFSVPPPPPPKASGGSGGAGGSGAGGGTSPPGFVVPANAAIAAIQFAQAQVGKPYGASAGPTFYDCSGFMSDIFAVMTGKPYQGSERYFTTEANFPSLGFEPGFQAGAFNIGVNSAAAGFGANAHMAGTLPNGMNVEAGGGPGGVKYGGAAKGAKDFAQIYHLRVDRSLSGAYGDVPGATGLGDSGSSGQGDGIRVFVTNMGAGGMGSGGGGASGAGGFGGAGGAGGDPLSAFFGGMASQGGPLGPIGQIGQTIMGMVTGGGGLGGGGVSAGVGRGAPGPSMLDAINAFTGSGLGYAAGGGIPGYGGGDKFPILTEGGEFVVNKDAARQWLPQLHAINNGGAMPLADPRGSDPHGGKDSEGNWQPSLGPFAPWWDMDWMPPEHPERIGPSTPGVEGKWWHRGPTNAPGGGDTGAGSWRFPPIGKYRPRAPSEQAPPDPRWKKWGFQEGGLVDPNQIPGPTVGAPNHTTPKGAPAAPGTPGGPNIMAPNFAGRSGSGGPPPGPGAPGMAPPPGMPSGFQPAGFTPDAPRVQGRAPGEGGWQPEGPGFQGLGGLPLAAIKSAASASPIPGAGAGADMAIELANKVAAFGGKAAAIGAQGLMETFLPIGSELGDPSKGWLGKLVGGFAGAKPGGSNTAGKLEIPTKPSQEGSAVDPNTKEHGKGGGRPPGPTNGVYIENLHNNGKPDDGTKVAQDINRGVSSAGAGQAWSG